MISLIVGKRVVEKKVVIFIILIFFFWWKYKIVNIKEIIIG